MGSRKIKSAVLALLRKDKWLNIAAEFSKYNETDVINPLFSALCNIDQLCKWNSVSAFGVVIPRLADKDIESARVIMRRFLWSLNDESGGIGWGAPESMAEIMVHSEVIFSEYVHMLLSYMRQDGPEILQDGNYLELPALQQGLLWGVGRLLSSKRQAMLGRDIERDVESYLLSPDKTVRGLAVWCLGMCNEEYIVEKIYPLLKDQTRFILYQDYNLKEVSVADLARQAIMNIKKINS